MKIIPEQPTSLINQVSDFRLRLDKGACCFFVLGMFLAGLFIHMIGLFPTV